MLLGIIYCFFILFSSGLVYAYCIAGCCKDRLNQDYDDSFKKVEEVEIEAKVDPEAKFNPKE